MSEIRRDVAEMFQAGMVYDNTPVYQNKAMLASEKCLVVTQLSDKCLLSQCLTGLWHQGNLMPTLFNPPTTEHAEYLLLLGEVLSRFQKIVEDRIADDTV